MLKIARKAIEEFVKNGNVLEYPDIQEKRGVFVTIHKNNQLRGCIGIPYPEKPLGQALVEAAISSTRDPRFPPLKSEELDEISLEISILTEPELIKDINEIQIGEHGLIIRKQAHSGLLLPQVPVEQGWDINQFLENLCLKAGLPSDSWKDSKIFKFKTQILKE